MQQFRWMHFPKLLSSSLLSLPLLPGLLPGFPEKQSLQSRESIPACEILRCD
jgi:hypothetical protein